MLISEVLSNERHDHGFMPLGENKTIKCGNVYHESLIFRLFMTAI